MEKKTLWLIIGFLVCLNVFALLKFNYLPTADRESRGSSQLEVLLGEMLKARTLSDGSVVDPNFHLANEGGDTILLADLIGEKSKLIVWISELSCQVCVDSVLFSVLSFIEDHSLEDQILIFADYQSKSYLNTYKRLNQISLPFYLPLDKQIVSTLELFPPYLFVVDSSMRFQNLFLPESHYLKEELDFFLNVFNNRFSNN